MVKSDYFGGFFGDDIGKYDKIYNLYNVKDKDNTLDV
jgi:hypothetical protein